MSAVEIFAKTEAGNQELRTRANNLPPRLRTMLFMVDGTRSTTELARAATMVGAPDDFLDNLRRLGLVTPLEAASQQFGSTAGGGLSSEKSTPATVHTKSESQRFAEIQKLMNDTVVDALGLRAFLFTLKLERCFTCADLAALQADYVKLIIKGNGPEVGRLLESVLREKLKN